MNGMAVPPRIGLITLACRDIERMASIFRALGWPEARSSDENHTVFQTTNGAPVALYGAGNYERVFGALPTGFRGFTLCVNLASMEEVRAAYETLARIDDVELLEEPQEQAWGGGFSWRDPEGNIWDVAWADGSDFDDRGGLRFP
jgi:catechol 2,3-dioxygenase-like lactoylglutathione lyase family enzyme